MTFCAYSGFRFDSNSVLHVTFTGPSMYFIVHHKVTVFCKEATDE